MVYLIHFKHKYHHAQHYIGYCNSPTNLQKRLVQHRHGPSDNGSPLIAAVTEAGIPWNVVRTWPSATQADERKLKNRHNAAHLCPICNPHFWQNNGNDL